MNTLIHLKTRKQKEEKLSSASAISQQRDPRARSFKFGTASPPADLCGSWWLSTAGEVGNGWGALALESVDPLQGWAWDGAAPKLRSALAEKLWWGSKAHGDLGELKGSILYIQVSTMSGEARREIRWKLSVWFYCWKKKEVSHWGYELWEKESRKKLLAMLHPHCPLSAVCLVAQSCLTFCNPMDCSPPGSFVRGHSPGKNTGVGCHFLLQGIFPTQESNPHLLPLLYCRYILYLLSHQESTLLPP